MGDVEKAWLEIDLGSQLPSRSLCGWMITEKGVSYCQAQEENACALIGLLEVVLREDGPGWLGTETMRQGGVLGRGACEMHRSNWWLNQMVLKKMGEKSLKMAC